MKIQKISDLNEPPVVGKWYLVPCLEVDKIMNIDWNTYMSDQEAWMDCLPYIKRERKLIPVYNIPHSDIESGQSQVHYHADLRFIGGLGYTIDLERRPLEYNYSKPVFVPLKCTSKFDEVVKISSIADLCRERKLKANMKCPHKGYNLNQCQVINNRVICPMHGLEWDLKTKMLV